jgi:hypothetical protein
VTQQAISRTQLLPRRLLRYLWYITFSHQTETQDWSKLTTIENESRALHRQIAP